jgi:hypothetical protein
VPLSLTGRGMPTEVHEAYGEELELLAADLANAQARQEPGDSRKMIAQELARLRGDARPPRK